MKIRKLLVVALTAMLAYGTVNVNAYAAEINTAETVADVESTEESANEDTEAVEENTSNIIMIEETFAEGASGGGNSTQEAEETEEIKEEIKKEEEKDQGEKEEEQKEKKTTTKKASAATAVKKASYTESELRLLSSLIFCEAGSEPYAGKLAVGIVVMNRIESKAFPDTMKNVIYQKYQFGPARNGSLSRALSSYDAGRFTTANHKDCIKAAKASLEGTKTVTYKGREINMKSMLYFSGKVSGAKLSIGNHQFK